MLVEFRTNALPHRIEDEIDSFAPSMLRRWNKVTVAGYEHNLGDLVLVGHRCNV